MNTVNEIFSELCRIAPLELQLPYDNAGFLIGRGEKTVCRVLLSLDVTEEVIKEAKSINAELIVSHHPVIWNALKSVTDADRANIKLLELIENGIAVISMHTNLDAAQGGVNDILISVLGAVSEGCFESDNCGRHGFLSKPIPLAGFLEICKERLKSNGIRYYDAGREVEHIAVLGGAGGGCVYDAFRCGCDTYVTSDIKYHEMLLARELGINLIDADHFCTENPVICMLRDRLSEAFPDTEFIISSVHGQTARFF